MKHPHPSSLLVLGVAVLLAASLREGAVLFAGALLLTLAALLAAKPHLHLLLRRSRWLLLSMLLMFGWLTPGTPVPTIPGASVEGLLLAAENLARLLVALSVVALLLRSLSPLELVAGIHSLLAPLAAVGISRDRIAVRLALTLGEVESSRAGGDVTAATPTTLHLARPEYGAVDAIAGIAALVLILAAWPQ